MEHYSEIQRRDGTLFFACADDDREAIATSIERLIDMLDAMEVDPDLEPYLAGTTAEGDDREGDADGQPEADNADDEPSLGASNDYSAGTQERWAFGDDDDREDDGDDLEPTLSGGSLWGNGCLEYDLEADESDKEPSLGWTAAIDQSSPRRFGGQSGSDREEDGDEQDCSRSEDERPPHELRKPMYDGTGTEIAGQLIRSLPAAAKRADAYTMIGVPLVYEFERVAR